MANNTTLEMYNQYYNELLTNYNTLPGLIQTLQENLNSISNTLQTYKTEKIFDTNNYIQIYQTLLKYRESYSNVFSDITNKKNQINTYIEILNTKKNQIVKNNIQYNNIIVILDNFIELNQQYNNIFIGLSNYWNNYVEDFTQKLYKILLNIYIQKFKNNTSKINLKSLPTNTKEKYQTLSNYKLEITNIRTYINNLSTVMDKIKITNPNNNKLIDSIITSFTTQLDNIESSVDMYLNTSRTILKNSNNKSIIDIKSSLTTLLQNLLTYMQQFQEMSNSSQLSKDYEALKKSIVNLGENKLNTDSKASVKSLGEILGQTEEFKSILNTSLPLIIQKIKASLGIQNSVQPTTILQPGTKVTFNTGSVNSYNQSIQQGGDIKTGVIESYSNNVYTIKSNNGKLYKVSPSQVTPLESTNLQVGQEVINQNTGKKVNVISINSNTQIATVENPATGEQTKVPVNEVKIEPTLTKMPKGAKLVVNNKQVVKPKFNSSPSKKKQIIQNKLEFKEGNQYTYTPRFGEPIQVKITKISGINRVFIKPIGDTKFSNGSVKVKSVSTTYLSAPQ